MAQAVEQYIPRDEDRWTLDQAFDYLTGTLGYPEERVLREMEQQRLAGRLAVQVHKIVDGKPQGDPEYLSPDKKHKLVRDRGWVRPLALKWGGDRCTVYKQRVLELWPMPSALQPPDETVAEPLKPKAWLPIEHKRRQQLNDTPKDITTYAQQLHEAAVEAVGQRRLTNAPSARRIETLLHELDLFPKIQRRTKHARYTHD